MLKTNRTTYRTLHVGPLAALCLLMLTACSSDTVQPDNGTDQQGKTPIELTVGIMGEGSAATRTVVTNDDLYGQKAKAFEAGTSLYMVMKSEKEGGTGTDVKYSRTIGYAQEKVDDDNTSVKFAANYVRYWEDSYSRDSKLSVYAVCVPGYYLPASKKLSDNVTGTGTEDNIGLSINNSNVYTYSGSTTTAWTDASPATVVWPLRDVTTVAKQTSDFINNQDLCFSNNVANLAFNTTDKKFGSGRMVFYHALTKITFKISKGDGFAAGDAFAFSNANENIVLKGFNTGGTFDIVKGEFTASTVKADTEIKELANTKATGASEAHVLSALLVPGTDLSDATVPDAIHFTLEHNEYKLTKKALMDAIGDKKLPHKESLSALTDDHKMRAGVHYIFDLTVGKTKIEKITAALVPWEEVTASPEISNARIELNLLDNGVKQEENSPSFDLFRLADNSTDITDSYTPYNWASGYNTDGKATLTWESNVYSTTWLWESNKHHYHFRAVSPNTTDTWKIETDATNGDYITLIGEEITSSNVDTNGKYKGVCWGAPFYNITVAEPTSARLTYDTNTRGFDGKDDSKHQIYHAIGSTKAPINIEMFHMMSDVTIQLTTSGDSDPDKVTLTGAKLEFTNIASSGTVKMGNGLVTPGAKSTFDKIGTPETAITVDEAFKWRYAFVPQTLDGGNDAVTTDDVVLTITTADNNQYKVNMKDVAVASNNVSNKLIANPYTTGKIDRWYPNFKYTYTFTLKKTDISVSATLADWENVTAGDDNVQIE